MKSQTLQQSTYCLFFETSLLASTQILPVASSNKGQPCCAVQQVSRDEASPCPLCPYARYAHKVLNSRRTRNLGRVENRVSRNHTFRNCNSKKDSLNKMWCGGHLQSRSHAAGLRWCCSRRRKLSQVSVFLHRFNGGAQTHIKSSVLGH